MVSQDHNGGEKSPTTSRHYSLHIMAACYCVSLCVSCDTGVSSTPPPPWEELHRKYGAVHKIFDMENKYVLGLHINWVFVSKILIRLYSHCPPKQIIAKYENRRLQREPIRVSKQARAKAESSNRIFIFVT